MGQGVMAWCNYCDPKHFTIYGFCKNCRRRCECPLYDPKSGMSPLDHAAFMALWNKERSDLIIDYMRRSERGQMGNP